MTRSSRAPSACLGIITIIAGTTVSLATCRAQERSIFDGEAGARTRGEWGWSSAAYSIKGDAAHEIVVAATGTRTASLEPRKAGLDALAKAGSPVLALERLGLLHGTAAAVVSRTTGTIWSSSDARWDLWQQDTSVKDLDRIEAAVNKLDGAVELSQVIVAPGGSVLAAEATPVSAKAARKKALAHSIALIDGWRREAKAADVARKLISSGEETDPVAARKVALYLEKENESAAQGGNDSPSIGFEGALEEMTGPGHPAALGKIDVKGAKVDKDVYRRGSYGTKPEVQVRELPPIETRTGTTSAPLLYQSSLAIDSDGSGNAYKTDPDGQPDTSMTDANGNALDPTKVPYFVLPLGFAAQHPGVKLGDIAAVMYDGKVAYAIWGDEGPPGQIGEGSILLAKELGIDANPRTGGADHGVTWMVFPGSGDGSVPSRADIARRGAALLAKAGGAPPKP